MVTVYTERMGSMWSVRSIVRSIEGEREREDELFCTLERKGINSLLLSCCHTCIQSNSPSLHLLRNGKATLQRHDPI